MYINAIDQYPTQAFFPKARCGPAFMVTVTSVVIDKKKVLIRRYRRIKKGRYDHLEKWKLISVTPTTQDEYPNDRRYEQLSRKSVLALLASKTRQTIKGKITGYQEEPQTVEEWDQCWEKDPYK